MDNKSRVMKEYDEKKALYESFAFKIRQLLEDMIRNEKISYNSATCRVKDRDSLSKKIDRKQDKYQCLEDLTDIAGVRIITFYSDDVDRVVELVEKEFQVDRVNSIDKGKSLEPDRFGYCSVHYVVGMSSKRLELREYQPYKGLKCEIQIRTVLQHAWAEIEHDLGYKSETTIPKDIRRNFSRLAGLLEIGDKEFLEIRKFLSSYTDEVAERISDDVLDDREIDDIIIKEFVRTDKDIIRINKKIEAVSGLKLDGGFTVYDCEYGIKQLFLLDIRTLKQLKQMIVRNEAAAVEIAQIVLQHDKEEFETYLSEMISVIYLCYAELLIKYHDYDSIKRHMVDMHTAEGEEFANCLFDLKKQLKL